MAANPSETQAWVDVGKDIAALYREFTLTPRERQAAEVERQRAEAAKAQSQAQVLSAQSMGKAAVAAALVVGAVILIPRFLR